jgi:hypothetical protein
MMRNTIGIILLILSLSFQLNAQSFTENDIIGTWTVRQINVLTKIPDEQKKTVDMLKAAFLRSKFIFNSDNSFVFDFELEKMQIQNGHWKYNDYTKSIIIQDWKDKDTNDWKLMEIVPKKDGDKIIFQLHDIFIELVMNKEY